MGVIWLKAIKFIKELLCSLCSYNNLQYSDFCSPRPLGMMMKAFSLIIDCSMRCSWLSSFLLFIYLSLVWSIPKAIHFTHKLHTQVIGVAIKTYYLFHRFDFHRSDLSSKQFTLLMNCTLSFIIYLGSNAVITTGLSSHKSRFICYFRITALLRGIVLQ